VEKTAENTIELCIRNGPSSVIHIDQHHYEEVLMDEIDFTNIDEKHLESWSARVALAETLLDEKIDKDERDEIRRSYQRQHMITGRTVRNYLKRYREEGALGLLFHRGTTGPTSPRIHDQALAAKILALVKERPRRTVPTLRKLISNDPEYHDAICSISDRTIYRFLEEQGFSHKQRSAMASRGAKNSYQQFQASASMELVQGDARDGIWLPDPHTAKMRKTYLFAWIDDYSRKILSARYFFDEKLPRMEDTFKTMILRWGIPKNVYLDNGNVYIAAHFAFVLSQLGIRKIHHPPYQAWCKGKAEAAMKTFKYGFQGEAQLAGFKTLDELNSALWAWIDIEYNRKNHSSTGETPEKRFSDGLPKDHKRVEELAWFEALFLLRESRTVSKYGIIKLLGNQYRCQAPHGTVAEIRYNPFDMRTVWRFENSRCVETLKPHKIINAQSRQLPEEANANEQKVSASASAYFAALRERQAQVRREADLPRYENLKGKEDRS
jgi:transposase InsO family protein